MLGTLGLLPTEMWRENRSREVLWSWVSWETHHCSVVTFSSCLEGCTNCSYSSSREAVTVGSSGEKSTHCEIYSSKQLDRNLSSWETETENPKGRFFFLCNLFLPLVLILSPGAPNSNLCQTKRQPCMTAHCKGAQRNLPVHFSSQRWRCGCFIFICPLWVASTSSVSLKCWAPKMDEN